MTGDPQQWPAWATERVAVHAPDPAWQARGRREAAALQLTLGRWLLAPVEHVGSTAVPGLAAKPVLDLQAAVADLVVAAELAVALAPHGWHHVSPELDERPYRRFFVRVQDGARAAHLHVLLAGSPRWRQQLDFRDALRADPELAAEYGRLKASLAVRHADDREAYTRGKGEFVRGVLDR